MPQKMQRVVIIGRGASGKSALAVELAGITGLPVIELDKIFGSQALLRHLEISGWRSSRILLSERAGSWTAISDPTTLSMSASAQRTPSSSLISRLFAVLGGQSDDPRNVQTSGGGSSRIVAGVVPSS